MTTKQVTAWDRKVTLAGVQAIECECGWKTGAAKKCDHVLRAERDARMNAAPLNGNRGFSLLR